MLDIRFVGGLLYYGNETDYGHNTFQRREFTQMAEVLKGLQGRFILSLNDLPAVRETFAGFRIPHHQRR